MNTARVHRIEPGTTVDPALFNDKPVTDRTGGRTDGPVVGVTKNARVEHGYVVVDIVATDQEALDALLRKNLPFADLGDLKEDERIDTIVAKLREKPNHIIGVVVDSDPGKAQRYIAKVFKKLPGVTLVDQSRGPVRNTTLVRLRYPA